MIDSEGGEKRHGGGSATGFILININEKDRKMHQIWHVTLHNTTFLLGLYRQRISESKCYDGLSILAYFLVFVNCNQPSSYVLKIFQIRLKKIRQ